MARYSDLSLLRMSCGLTLREVSDYFEIPLDQVRAMEKAEIPTPPLVVKSLEDMFVEVDNTSRYGRPANGLLAKGIARRSREMLIVKKFNKRKNKYNGKERKIIKTDRGFLREEA